MANDFGGVLIKVVVADAAVVNAAAAWPRRLDREINAVRANVEEVCREFNSINEIIVRLFTWLHVALQSTSISRHAQPTCSKASYSYYSWSIKERNHPIHSEFLGGYFGGDGMDTCVHH
eukprot:scaffold16550_cov148-Skeletonema_marinoi.AAC.2